MSTAIVSFRPTAGSSPSTAQVALRNNGFDATGLIKRDARWNKGSLRQIAGKWNIPLWLLKRILSPRFPDPNPAERAFMTEGNYRRIKTHYLS